METSNYSKTKHWLAAGPFIISMVGWVFQGLNPGGSDLGVVYSAALIITSIVLLVIYVGQRKFLRNQGYSTRLRNQTIFIVSALMIPAVAMIAGDQFGLMEFGPSANSSSLLPFGLLFSLVTAVCAIQICALGNVFFIITNGTSSVIKFLGLFVRVLAWLCLLIVSYLAFSTAYSFRDPNTE